MLLNLHKKEWTHGLQLEDYKKHLETNQNTIKVPLFFKAFFNQNI